MTAVANYFQSSIFAAPSSSAGGLLAYLKEDNANLKVRALTKLYQVVDLHWAEVSDALPFIEELSEDPTFPAADLAAAIASKCFYHLQEYDDALKLALSAGKYFDISVKSEYVDTLLAKCVDEYKKLSQEDGATIDPRIEHIMERMYQRCYRDGCFEQALGIALDTNSVEKVDEVCRSAIAAGKEQLLDYAYNLCQGARNITSRKFRLSVVDVLVKFYETLPDPDFSNMCFGLQYLDRPLEVAQVLQRLLAGSPENALMAYQIAFDLLDTENQGFILRTTTEFASLPAPEVSSAVSAEESKDAMDVDSSSGAQRSVQLATELTPAAYEERVAKLKRILLGGFDVDLLLNFLFKQSQTDPNILKHIKGAIEGRSNILHNSTVVAHAYLNGGTTRDQFLRENLEWLGKASNWAKFTAVGSIGVVHKGHVHESMNLLQPYLPTGGQSSSPYSESGALYALGLIHANKGGAGDSTTIAFLTDSLRNAGVNEIVQHGACLGIGLAGMATGNDRLFDDMKQVLLGDSAVAGEGAALGMGLLMVGQAGSNLFEATMPELWTYAHDTRHEKVVRAVALSIAMMVYGKEEGADGVIEQLVRDRDPIIRYGGMFAIAMAYCGTADNRSIRQLLHVAVSDVSDDVRRAAVMALGFVNFRNPESVPKLVQLLSESFNPHVRYGACLAVGVACAGTALKEAIDLLSPMLEDAIDFVRQGALISMAMVYQEVAEARSPSSKKFRELLVTIVNDKHQPIMAKAGAILASGIIDAGGRNVVVSMQSRTGFMKMGGAVGLMMFLQHWYWYPLMLFLSLSFNPTVLIGLNKDFDMPSNFEVLCQTPPSMFAYPKVEEKKEDEKKLVATAVLSTTAKAKAREARKEARKAKAPTDGPKSPASSKDPAAAAAAAAAADNMDIADPIPMERVHSHLSTMSYLSIEDKSVHEESKPKKEREPTSFVLSNPSRLTPGQGKYISLQPQQRYVPVSRRATPAGIVLLTDNDPSAPEQVVKVERLALGADEEAEAPEPFVWDPNDP